MNLDPGLFTVIITFDVGPENQADFVAELLAAVEGAIATIPGFRGATFFVSDDGTRVINLAQWDSADIYQRSMREGAPRGARIGDVIERHGARVVHGDSYRVARKVIPVGD